MGCSRARAKEKEAGQDVPGLSTTRRSGATSPRETLLRTQARGPACPIATRRLSFQVGKSGRPQVHVPGRVPQDGKLLLRIRLKHTEDGYSAGRLAYRADEDIQASTRKVCAAGAGAGTAAAEEILILNSGA